MNGVYRGRGRRVSLGGWMKWVAVLAVPFSVLFYEARMNAQRLKGDYEVGEINKRIADKRKILHALKVREANLRTERRLAIAASDYQLVKAQPDQISVVYYREDIPKPSETLNAEPYVMASHTR